MLNLNGFSTVSQKRTVNTETYKVSSQDVYETYDYDSIKDVKGNRPINKKNVDKLVKSIREEGQLVNCMVGKVRGVEGYVGLDIQHRRQSCRLLGIPLRYVVIDKVFDSVKDALRYIQNINTKHTPWSLLDHLYSRCEFSKDVESHKRFRNIIELVPEKDFLRDKDSKKKKIINENISLSMGLVLFSHFADVGHCTSDSFRKDEDLLVGKFTEKVASACEDLLTRLRKSSLHWTNGTHARLTRRNRPANSIYMHEYFMRDLCRALKYGINQHGVAFSLEGLTSRFRSYGKKLNLWENDRQGGELDKILEIYNHNSKPQYQITMGDIIYNEEKEKRLT